LRRTLKQYHFTQQGAAIKTILNAKIFSFNYYHSFYGGICSSTAPGYAS
jgi:hypothetical protein